MATSKTAPTQAKSAKAPAKSAAPAAARAAIEATPKAKPAVAVAIEIQESEAGSTAASVSQTGPATAPDLQTAAPGPQAPASVQMVEKTEPAHKEMLTMDKAIKTAEEFVSFGQGNVEALLKSSQIWAAGVQDLGKHLAASAQASMDETMATVKALSSVKSVKEAIDLQTSFSKTSFEKLVAESGKLTDATVKLAEQALAPITERVTIATEKFRPAA